ncbi:SCP2 sterol-binding domain-containing protein [Herpetosiphon giganteus]|uniref:SCP2 sterol-binding domain-containing protein n=1 Tax=Herpetosiphon giganteus TaxID=2029754 RepID=UPI0019597C59|nr:SCP2 sterol-binding domain-containing protein [Herpetosiphon giganteus]MBM7845185.1 putative sterol carrier protein [Herpetosiphon giganteus]
MTIDELFKTMPSRFNTAAAAGLNKTIQWNIVGEESGTWAFQIVGGEGHLIPNGVENPDVTFTTSAKDWIAIAEGKLDSMKAFMAGKLKVDGDMMLAMKMPQFFPVENA